ncbi:ABC transporter substrate-binding protein [Demequina soli]|uniref:ABC transporter substrate-binding protein n=1 Tax=Demequina soli TaxID=1638987 RepID=UPI000780377A|nr:ABC transporter substrate-binding protein [Demequina soli]
MRTISRSSQKLRFSAAVFATAAILATAACSSAGDEPESSGSAAPADSVDTPTELSIAIQREPQGFDVVNLSAGTDAYIWASLYDRLLVSDADGLPAPSAATAWEWSDDELTLTLTLRDDLTFSDGSAATSADVVATLQKIQTETGPNQATMALVSGIEAPDDTTVVITFSAKDAAFLDNLTKITGVIGDDASLDAADAVTNPLGSGPYTLDTAATVTGSQYVLLKRDDYWNADAYPFETVTIKVIADTTAMDNALLSGEINVGDVGQGSLDSAESQGIALTEIPGSGLFNLKFLDRDGTIVPALADERVREAINMALDRAGIATALMQGYATPVEQIAFPDTASYVPSLDDTYAYDVEAAKALMAEAGYADGFSVTMPSLIYTSTMDATVTQLLSDIGITVEWVPIPASDTAMAIMGGEYAMAVWVDGLATPARQFLNTYDENAFQNPFHNTDPELTELLNALKDEVDPVAQGPLAQAVNEWVVEHAWDAPIVNGTRVIGAREGYAYLGSTSNSFTTLSLFGVEG